MRLQVGRDAVGAPAPPGSPDPRSMHGPPTSHGEAHRAAHATRTTARRPGDRLARRARPRARTPGPAARPTRRRPRHAHVGAEPAHRPPLLRRRQGGARHRRHRTGHPRPTRPRHRPGRRPARRPRRGGTARVRAPQLPHRGEGASTSPSGGWTGQDVDPAALGLTQLARSSATRRARRCPRSLNVFRARRGLFRRRRARRARDDVWHVYECDNRSGGDRCHKEYERWITEFANR